MPGGYTEHLRADDPLHGYLSDHVLPYMGVTAQRVDFRVFCLKETKVYRYEESHSRKQVVGRFFVNGSHYGSVAMDRMRQEFENLQVLRGYGLAGYLLRRVRPGVPAIRYQPVGRPDFDAPRHRGRYGRRKCRH